MLSVHTVESAIKIAVQELKSVSDTPRLDAEILLMDILKVNKSYLLAHSAERITDQAAEVFYQQLNLRKKGVPIAYLTGKKAFWSIELMVSPDVLIPRPETERLVELTLQLLPANEPIRIADLGTGSGAIAIALACERPNWEIWATDCSPHALAIAQANASRYHLNNLFFAQGDWCQALPPFTFSAIVSNPPYIAESDPHLQALQYEPSQALIAAENGMADLSKIISQAPSYLASGGLLLLEHGHDQGFSVTKKLYNQQFINVKIYSDLAGNDRVSQGYKQ